MTFSFQIMVIISTLGSKEKKKNLIWRKKLKGGRRNFSKKEELLIASKKAFNTISCLVPSYKQKFSAAKSTYATYSNFKHYDWLIKKNSNKVISVKASQSFTLWLYA